MTIPAYSPVPVTTANVISFMTTDPLGIGLSAIRTANPGQDAPLLAVLTVASPTFQVPSSPMTSANFVELLDADELAAMTAVQAQEYNILCPPNGTVNIGDAPIQRDLNALFASFPVSLAAIRARYTRNATPWEYWFGAGAVPTTSILDAARNAPPGNNF